jgi:hypothetical protein
LNSNWFDHQILIERLDGLLGLLNDHEAILHDIFKNPFMKPHSFAILCEFIFEYATNFLLEKEIGVSLLSDETGDIVFQSIYFRMLIA